MQFWNSKLNKYQSLRKLQTHGDKILKMKRIHFFFILSFLLGFRLVAQVPDLNYFPAKLMKGDGVKSFQVYETQIDDPTAQSGKANRIRLAKNNVRQAYFDRDGNMNRQVWLSSDGKFVQRECNYAFDKNGDKIFEDNKNFHTNNSDSTKLIQTIEKHIKNGYHGELLTSNRYLRSTEALLLTDSVAFLRDESRKLIEEVSTHFDKENMSEMRKAYTYAGNQITVSTIVAEKEINRDEYVLDDKGRIATARYFTAGELTPRMEASYAYHPRGWLEEINYTHNWDFFDKIDTVISVKNKYDDHGKLFETQKDYGNGKRLFEFYDYSYFVNWFSNWVLLKRIS